MNQSNNAVKFLRSEDGAGDFGAGATLTWQSLYAIGHNFGLYCSLIPLYMKTYVKFGALMVVIVGSLIWLAAGGVSETKTYYKTIPELQEMGKTAQGKRVRIGGDVQPGSILKRGTEVTFILHQGPKTLNVSYTGADPLPDTFRDNAQALADGRLGADGVFEASKIQAKCASKYEAKPAQRGLTHDGLDKRQSKTPATSNRTPAKVG